MRKWTFLLALIALTGCVEDTEPGEMIRESPEVDQPNNQMVDEDRDVLDNENNVIGENNVDVDPDANNTNMVDLTCGEGCLDTFPIRIVDTTVGGAEAFDAYSCAPETNESGPERTYKIVISEPGFFAAQVVGEGQNVDVDLHLLREEDPSSCVDRGHLTVGSFIEPGAYFLVVDSWVDDADVSYEGDFEVAINVVRGENLAAFGLNEQAADDAVRAFGIAWANDDSDRLEYTVTDFSMHSREARQWIVQMATGELMYNLTVAHGEGSIDGEDLGYATIFSNTPQSHQSSLGMILSAETYTGMFGYSMRLDGLEEGFNSNVRTRDIVVHPWNGNLPEVIEREGGVVSSWGCPTLVPTISTEVIDSISNGSLMFFWYPDPIWQLNSTYL